MVFKSFYRYLFVDQIKIRKDDSFLRKSMFVNNCYKLSARNNLPVQFVFYSIHLIMFLLLIEKVYIYCANLDELELITFMDTYKMIGLNSYMNLIHISLIVNAQHTYHTFYIEIDDYYTFHLNAVLNDDSTALFGSFYFYRGYLATKYVRMKMLKMLDLFYIPDLTPGL